MLNFRSLLLATSIIGSSIFGYGYSLLPKNSGHIVLDGLRYAVQISFDNHAIPVIHASNRTDAFYSLGFVTARERLFQMDLMRRKSAGRLAEIFGSQALAADRWHRILGMEQTAQQILKRLPANEQEILLAYCTGVNAAMVQMPALPFEFTLLGYRPERWRSEDSLLVLLGMYEVLSWNGDEERMATVMRAAMPTAAFDFFTPDSDRYTDKVTHNLPHRPVMELPVAALQELLAQGGAVATKTVIDMAVADRLYGSNAWVVSPAMSRKGYALIANDMHLENRVPPIWYRAELHYGGTHLAGLTLPGIPSLITGSNGRVAWGYTSSKADVTDLVTLDMPLDNPNAYWIPGGRIEPFGTRFETIKIKGAPDAIVQVKTTRWGPVWPEPLLGKPVAIHWSALDPAATNLSAIHLDEADTVQKVLPIFNRIGAPPLNVLVADKAGNIGWTLAGKLPHRVGGDGFTSQSWTNGHHYWDGYISPEQLPRIVNPSEGFIVNANQRVLGNEYPQVLGYNYAAGYRAFRIEEQLRVRRLFDENDMLGVQLDTSAEFYRYYQQLALQVLAQNNNTVSLPVSVQDIQAYLNAWDGRAEPGSSGIALLVAFRRELASEILAPFFAVCLARDSSFNYFWAKLDEPLQAILSARIPALLADKRYRTWEEWIMAILANSTQGLMRQYRVSSLKELTWGKVNRTQIQHPLSKVMPEMVREWLDMPVEPLPGCEHCVRTANNFWGASARMAVTPAQEEKGVLHMPAGQSGYFWSEHYRDQQEAWLRGLPIRFLSEKKAGGLELVPR